MKHLYMKWLILTVTVLLQSEDRRSISVGAACDTVAESSEPIRECEDSVSQCSVSMGAGRGQLQTEPCTEPTSPPKTPSSVSLAESMQSASHSESIRKITVITEEKWIPNCNCLTYLNCSLLCIACIYSQWITCPAAVFAVTLNALSSGGGKLRPSRVQSVVSSQGSLDSDMQGESCTYTWFHQA